MEELTASLLPWSMWLEEFLFCESLLELTKAMDRFKDGKVVLLFCFFIQIISPNKPSIKKRKSTTLLP